MTEDEIQAAFQAYAERWGMPHFNVRWMPGNARARLGAELSNCLRRGKPITAERLTEILPEVPPGYLV